MKPYKEIEMKLNRDRFEIFAKEQGYGNQGIARNTR